MPTGYTADVQSGKVTEFDQFAMQCARAFGALIMMRDEPMDAPIPDAFQPSDYNQKALLRAHEELLAVEAMTIEEVHKAARAEYDEAVKEWQLRKERKAAERHRYEDMLAKVEAWEAPSVEHREFKNFMLSQLRESIDHDCSMKYEMTPKFKSDWRAKKIESLRHNIEYHEKGDREERERTAGRNLWVRQLRESLCKQPTLSSRT